MVSNYVFMQKKKLLLYFQEAKFMLEFPNQIFYTFQSNFIIYSDTKIFKFYKLFNFGSLNIEYYSSLDLSSFLDHVKDFYH